jgi:membrane-associated phospholipid phosphatase
VVRRLWIASAVCAVVTAIAIVTIDQPVARWINGVETYPKLWDAGLGVLEYAAGLEPWKWLGICVLAGGAVIATLIGRGQRAWMFVALVHLLERNAIFWLKPATGRLRPHEWSRHGEGPTFFRDGVSFPSGHVGLFASIAIPIAVVFPRARIPAAIVVVYSMLARIAVDAHFVSDTTGALALALALTAACSPLIRPASPR